MTQPPSDHADRRVQTVCLLILTFIAIGFALKVLQPVLVPFVMAVFLSYCLGTLIDAEVRFLHLPRRLAVLLTAIAGIAGIVFLAIAIVHAVETTASNLGDYQVQLDEFIQKIAAHPLLQKWGFKLDPDMSHALAASKDSLSSFIANSLAIIRDVLSNGLIVLLFMLFMLAGGARNTPRSGSLLTDIQSSVQLYITQTVAFSILTALLVGATLWILGVKFAVVFGLLTFMLNFIPTLGPIIATLLPLPIVLMSNDMSGTAQILAFVLPAAIQMFIGSAIQPRFQGKALRLHPVAVLMALIFFGMIWGLVGAFLAVPIAAIIRIILQRIDATRPLADLLAGNLDSLHNQKTP